MRVAPSLWRSHSACSRNRRSTLERTTAEVQIRASQGSTGAVSISRNSSSTRSEEIVWVTPHRLNAPGSPAARNHALPASEGAGR